MCVVASAIQGISEKSEWGRAGWDCSPRRLYSSVPVTIQQEQVLLFSSNIPLTMSSLTSID